MQRLVNSRSLVCIPQRAINHEGVNIKSPVFTLRLLIFTSDKIIPNMESDYIPFKGVDFTCCQVEYTHAISPINAQVYNIVQTVLAQVCSQIFNLQCHISIWMQVKISIPIVRLF